MEICHALDLEWKEIVGLETETKLESEPEIEPEIIDPLIGELLVAVERSAARARNALNPYILSPIHRQTLLEKCLKEIRAGFRENKRRFVPILGAAGYGKSTILGNIYDELHAEQTESGNG